MRVDLEKGCASHHKTGKIFARSCIKLKRDRGFSLVAARFQCNESAINFDMISFEIRVLDMI
jgi:hypothetical protein